MGVPGSAHSIAELTKLAGYLTEVRGMLVLAGRRDRAPVEEMDWWRWLRGGLHAGGRGFNRGSTAAKGCSRPVQGWCGLGSVGCVFKGRKWMSKSLE